MKNPKFLLGPIVVGSIMIQRVKSYKLLGVFIDDDLKWSTHVDYINKKACKRLYSLRGAGVPTTGMLASRPIVAISKSMVVSNFSVDSEILILSTQLSDGDMCTITDTCHHEIIWPHLIH